MMREEALNALREFHNDSLPENLTTKQVAKILNVTPRTVVNWRNKGKLPFHKIGGKVLYKKVDVRRLT
ncbi:MAG: helix-turn-helix domain-containing protein [Nitrosopumilaceae archaeon]|nr:helix-turn-helix domain-containing protein [Nitrosopumilaceae archaeon]